MCFSTNIIARTNPGNSPTTGRGRIQDLFKREHIISTLFIVAIWFLQASGYWGVTVYLPEYMSSLGVDGYFNVFMVFIGEFSRLNKS
jgi:hypothetical protein